MQPAVRRQADERVVDALEGPDGAFQLQAEILIDHERLGEQAGAFPCLDAEPVVVEVEGGVSREQQQAGSQNGPVDAKRSVWRIILGHSRTSLEPWHDQRWFYE